MRKVSRSSSWVTPWELVREGLAERRMACSADREREGEIEREEKETERDRERGERERIKRE